MMDSKTITKEDSIGIVLIDKNGTLEQAYISGIENIFWDIQIEELYKMCGYRLSDKANNDKLKGFTKLHTFTYKSFPKSHRSKSGFLKETENGNDTYDSIVIFGKKDGKAGTENKYEFPPPIDNDLFFGKLCIVRCSLNDKDDKCKLLNLSVKEWKYMYECLFGGFDKCNSVDDESSDDEEIESELPQTKHGYAKDGFIVDDDVSDEDYSEGEYSDEEEFYFSDDE